MFVRYGDPETTMLVTLSVHLYVSTVHYINLPTVIGPTPPGTGVM